MILHTLIAAAWALGGNDLPAHEVKVVSENDRDLAPIGRAIGDARIVQLGELTHGDGTSFQLKTRLVHYLHARCGFDVLVWESGLPECERMNEKIAGSGPIWEAARLGVFSHWSAATESIGVFEYARESYKTARPLRMSGFDLQSSGSRANLIFLDVFREVLEVPGVQAAPSVVSEMERLATLPYTDEREDAILAMQNSVGAVVEANRDLLVQAWGQARVGELDRVLANWGDYREMMRSFRRYQKQPTLAEFKLGYDLREQANFRNLEWLANVKYRGKKLIVWAHNAHISHQGATGTGFSRWTLDSTGRMLKNRFGAQVYSIGVVASSGKSSRLGGSPTEFVPSKPGSLEKILETAGQPVSFLDFRALPRGHRLRQPLPGYLNRQNGELQTLRWPTVFDGVLYVKSMEPRTNLRP